MTIETQKQRLLPLLVPALIGIVNILMGVLGFFLIEDLFYQVLSVFLIIPGTLILLYSFREFKNRQVEKPHIKHDERSEKNRLKAADLGFRFLFVIFLILILLNAIKVINEIVFVAVTGPIIAVGITLYYIGYYWFERRG
jgi:zinc transporter ZupT